MKIAKSRILVTGGSGFIGTALIVSLRNAGHDVMSLDLNPPQNRDHNDLYQRVDILDAEALRNSVQGFAPDFVVHLAARADLDGKTLNDYRVNTAGVSNVIAALGEVGNVKQAIFASSKLVCAGGYHPESDEDYSPNTIYGESKVAGERILRDDSTLRCPWCIVRPTSIWGPWFDVPYKGLFLAIARGYYFHLGSCDPPRSYGYVGNCVYQIEKIMDAPDDRIHRKTFYLSDYDEYTTRQWADAIAMKLRGRKARSVPEFVLQCGAVAGDCLKKLGWMNPPMTSFRLRNLRTDTTGIPLEAIKEITGPLPYSMEQGVDETIAWMRQRRMIA